MTGILFFFVLSSGAVASDQLALAATLAEEGDWPACLVECRRVEALNPGCPEVAGLRARAQAELARVQPGSPWWKRVGALPVKGLVGFYRVAIASALGNRCVLEPSCSAYSLQAARERGWLGWPMTGDRLIREPSVVQAGEKPVADGRGGVRYADPVSDHVGGGERGKAEE